MGPNKSQGHYSIIHYITYYIQIMYGVNGREGFKTVTYYTQTHNIYIRPYC